MREITVALLLILTASTFRPSEWSTWAPIPDGQENGVEFSYLITKCKDEPGGNFNMKIRSHYKAKICGRIRVVLALSTGHSRTLDYDFKNLDMNERTCYGILQICTTDRLISVSKVVFSSCDVKTPQNTGVNEIEFKKKTNKKN